MRKISFLLTGILIALVGLGQADTISSPLIRDGLVGIFRNEGEKKSLTKLHFSDEDYLDLYLQTGDAADVNAAKQKINHYLSGAGRYGQPLKSKDLKKLYKSVHEAFFRRYVDNPSFGQIFSTGDYNCATASALYALLLQQLSVLYDIRETPSHIYIVADPAAANIVFETTAPGIKIYQVTDKFKTQYLNYLISNKIVTASDVSGGNRDAVFEKHFYGDEKIDRKKLAGLLYYNMGVDALTKEDYTKAYQNFEKAYLLYPSKRIAYLASLSLGSLMAEKEKEVSDDAWPYGLRYLELNKTDDAKELFQGYCARLLKRYLFEQPEPAKVHRFYGKMLPYVTDTSLKRLLQYDYYYETAHHLYIKSNYDSSLVYLDAAYQLTPQNLLLQELIAQSLIQKSMPMSGKVADTVIVSRMEHYFERYPFLKSSPKVRGLYIIGLASATADLFQKNQKAAGDQMLKRFFGLMETDLPAVKDLQPYWAVLISEAYIYHIRQKQYKEARQFLLKVKKYIPDNEEVNKRIGYLDGGIY
ncbi:hypothetical protein LL912_01455 [Niabella sp. CC-SYL272]|uniref:hypothetical protein n=1 Tax=Niabella agricola TaxID=2891571 RepID=UPI001F3DC0AE|nr:hypothetical protein [Niabella agricola]MCF3107436.1 hypothetical protein [Niabella agricola]